MIHLNTITTNLKNYLNNLDFSHPFAHLTRQQKIICALVCMIFAAIGALYMSCWHRSKKQANILKQVNLENDLENQKSQIAFDEAIKKVESVSIHAQTITPILPVSPASHLLSVSHAAEISQEIGENKKQQAVEKKC